MSKCTICFHPRYTQLYSYNLINTFSQSHSWAQMGSDPHLHFLIDFVSLNYVESHGTDRLLKKGAQMSKFGQN